ncbi:MAG: hypothetical protein QOJ89_1226 [bacterium]|jgi:diguanylate cyclase (GGDEF)-like protein
MGDVRRRPPASFRRAVELSTTALVVVGTDAVVTYGTPSAGRMLRGPGSVLAGELFPALFTADERGVADAFLRRLADEDACRSTFMEATCTLADGDMRWIEITGVNLLGSTDVGGMVLNLTDATAHRVMLEQATRASRTDTLTGLGNRRALDERLAALEPMTVMLLDLDSFKLINDRWGHAAGDTVLTTVARRLCKILPVDGSAYRVGGDELMIVLPSADLERAVEVAENASTAIRAPSSGPSVTVSIGVAASREGEPESRMLARVDEAMYRVKRGDRGTIAVAGDELGDWAGRRASERAALEKAEASEAQLKADVERLTAENRHDARTGLLNAGAFETDIAAIDARARREGRPYAIALCDVDHFGRYNNRYLYHNGNRVLREVADAMSAVCRPHDVVYRYGGEELAVVLPDTELCDAAALAERLRCAVEELRIPHDNRPPPHHVTISVGVASIDLERHRTSEGLVIAANLCLLVAKSSGRNRVDSSPVRSVRA